MPHFDAILEEKIRLKEAFLKNQNIVNLLMNKGNNMAEFEDVKTGRKSPAAEYIKTHFHVPGTQQKDSNYISMRGRVEYADTDAVKETNIVIYIICNDDQIDLLQGSRADFLANEVDQVLNNGDTLFGLGGIRIGVAEEIQFADGFSGWQLPYTTHEFNRKAEAL